MKPSLLLACATIGLSALGACSHPVDCNTSYRGGCIEDAASAPAAPAPAPAPAPAFVAPAAAGHPPLPPVQPNASVPPAVPRGDPADFAAVDDRQCRSYGLVFGSHDYADCRIRLSAQHRGLDPDTNAPSRAASPGAPGR